MDITKNMLLAFIWNIFTFFIICALGTTLNDNNLTANKLKTNLNHMKLKIAKTINIEKDISPELLFSTLTKTVERKTIPTISITTAKLSPRISETLPAENLNISFGNKIYKSTTKPVNTLRRAYLWKYQEIDKSKPPHTWQNIMQLQKNPTATATTLAILTILTMPSQQPILSQMSTPTAAQVPLGSRSYLAPRRLTALALPSALIQATKATKATKTTSLLLPATTKIPLTKTNESRGANAFRSHNIINHITEKKKCNNNDKNNYEKSKRNLKCTMIELKGDKIEEENGQFIRKTISSENKNTTLLISNIKNVDSKLNSTELKEQRTESLCKSMKRFKRIFKSPLNSLEQDKYIDNMVTENNDTSIAENLNITMDYNSSTSKKNEQAKIYNENGYDLFVNGSSKKNNFSPLINDYNYKKLLQIVTTPKALIKEHLINFKKNQTKALMSNKMPSLDKQRDILMPSSMLTIITTTTKATTFNVIANALSQQPIIEGRQQEFQRSNGEKRKVALPSVYRKTLNGMQNNAKDKKSLNSHAAQATKTNAPTTLFEHNVMQNYTKPITIPLTTVADEEHKQTKWLSNSTNKKYTPELTTTMAVQLNVMNAESVINATTPSIKLESLSSTMAIAPTSKINVKPTRRRIIATTTLKPPPIIDDYQTIISQAGTHAYLPCNVKQLVKKPISWLRVFDGHILTVDQTTFIADQRFQAIYTPNPESWSLQIKYVQLKDAGTYECQVSTEPKASAIVYLYIVEPKTEIVGAPTKHVKAGSQVKLHCIISQAMEPPLFVNWFYNQKQIYLHNRKGWRTQIERIDIPPETTTITPRTTTKTKKIYETTSTTVPTTIVTTTCKTKTTDSITLSQLSRISTENIISNVTSVHDFDNHKENQTGHNTHSIMKTSFANNNVSILLSPSNTKMKYTNENEETVMQQNQQSKKQHQTLHNMEGNSTTWQTSQSSKSNKSTSEIPKTHATSITMAMSASTTESVLIKTLNTTHTTDIPDHSIMSSSNANLTITTANSITSNIVSTLLNESLITTPMTTMASDENLFHTQQSYSTNNWSPLPERQIFGIETSFMTLSPLMTVSIVKQITVATLIIPSVQKYDSGNYTCSPSNSQPRTVALHVLNGEYSASAITSSASNLDFCYVPTIHIFALKFLFIKKMFNRHYSGG